MMGGIASAPRRRKALTAPVTFTPQTVAQVRTAWVVVNPRAPGAGECDWRAAVAAALPAATVGESIVASAEQARTAAQAAAARGVELVIAVGGDGTANACINGVGDLPTRVAALSAGTANDLARLLGQPGRAAADLAALPAWQARQVDAITLGERRFHTVGGLGFPADVAITANRWRAVPWRRRLLRLIGSGIYTLACAVVILFRRRLGAPMRIHAAGGPDGDVLLDLDVAGLLVCNADRVGESFHLGTGSAIDDGLFELVLFPRMSRRRLLRAVLLARAGRLLEHPDIRWLRVRRAEIHAAAELPFFGDGEVLASGKSFRLRMAPRPARLMGPRR